MKNLPAYIEHTQLSATATTAQIISLCNEAKTYGFYGVCVNSAYVPLAVTQLKDSLVNVISTVGFPLGMMSSLAKQEEARQAVLEGANEIDMVINVGWLKSNLDEAIQQEIFNIKKAIEKATLKVIIETGYLTEEELVRAATLAEAAGADFVKTSTGFGKRGASLEDIQRLKHCLKKTTRIKASGGIKTTEDAISFIKAGADRIGTSSGVVIVNSQQNSL